MTSTPRRLQPSAVWLLAAALLSACAAGGEKPSIEMRSPPPAVNIERGLTLAQRECASCHAIGRGDASPAPMAPPFRSLAVSLSGPALENRLRTTSELGHHEMRPAGLEKADIRDLAAYIDSLD